MRKNLAPNKMKSLILILTMATNAIAVEQIFAINGGGRAHTDSDGITYQQRVSTNVNYSGYDGFCCESIRAADRAIYETFDYSNNPDAPLRYDIPLTSNGFYLMIVKFSYDVKRGNYLETIGLNNGNPIPINVNQCIDCGSRKICEVQIYFCVSNKMLYYKNHSTHIRNDKIDIEFTPSGSIETRIAGIVLLKGQLDERQELLSSPKNEPFFFNPNIMNSKCSPPPPIEIQESCCENTRVEINILQKSIDHFSDISLGNISNLHAVLQYQLAGMREANVDVHLAVKGLEQQQSNNTSQLGKEIERLSETSLDRFRNLNALVHSSSEVVKKAEMSTQEALSDLQRHQNDHFIRLHDYMGHLRDQNNQSWLEGAQTAIIREVQYLQKMVEQQISETIDAASNSITGNLNDQVSRMRSDMLSSIEQIDIKFEKLLYDLTLKIDRANRNIGMLHGMQKTSINMTSTIQAEQANMTSKICEINGNLIVINNLLHDLHGIPKNGNCP